MNTSGVFKTLNSKVQPQWLDISLTKATLPKTWSSQCSIGWGVTVTQMTPKCRSQRPGNILHLGIPHPSPSKH